MMQGLCETATRWGRHAAASRSLYIVAVAVPFVVLAGVVAAYGYRAPYWDEYGLVDVMDQYARGEKGLSDLWTAYSAHRAPVAGAVSLGLAWATRYHHAWFLAGTVVLAALAFAAIAFQIRRTGREFGLGTLDWRIPLVSLMVFSLSQWQVYLWGHLMLTYLCVLGSVLAMACLNRAGAGWAWLAGALAATVLASFTYGAALAVWPAGVVQLLLLRRQLGRRTWPAVGLWLAGAAAVMTAFLYGNAVAASQAAGAGAWRRPIAFAEYVCTYLGGAIMQFSEPAAMYLGALALLAAMALVAWAMTRRDALLREAAAPYAAWIVFGAAAAVATAIERLDQGRCQALSSRYISFSNLFYIGLFMTAWLAACRRNAPRKARKWAYPIAIWMFAALIGANAAYGLLCADERHDAFAPAAQAFREGRDRNLWGRLFPRVEEMPRYRQILLDRRWSIFREAPP